MTTTVEIARVQAALRRMLGSPELMLEQQSHGELAHIRIGPAVAGAVEAVEHDKARVWVATIPVMDDDMA